MVFGRTLREHMPCLPYKYAPTADWCVSQELRERMLAKSREIDGEKLSRHTKRLSDLPIGTAVAIQNQTGRHPTKWDKTGIIVEARPHEQLVIKVDGSRRLTLRNRRFVKELSPAASGSKVKPPNHRPTPPPQLIPTTPPPSTRSTPHLY